MVIASELEPNRKLFLDHLPFILHGVLVGARSIYCSLHMHPCALQINVGKVHHPRRLEWFTTKALVSNDNLSNCETNFLHPDERSRLV
jgi:hypothetical protein